MNPLPSNDNHNGMSQVSNSTSAAPISIEMNTLPPIAPSLPSTTSQSISPILLGSTTLSSTPNSSLQENHISHRVSRFQNEDNSHFRDCSNSDIPSNMQSIKEDNEKAMTPTIIDMKSVDNESKEDPFAEEDQCCKKLPRPLLVARKKLRHFLDLMPVHIIVYGAIIINALMMSVNTFDFEGHLLLALNIIDKICEITFIVEVILRLISHPLTYFKDVWVILDIGSVFVSLLPDMGIYSLIRLIKIIRLFSHITMIKSFFKTVIKSISSVLSIIACLFLVCYVYVLVGWTLFKDNYPEWFGDVWSSFFTLFQVMTLESWSSGIARIVMEENRAYAFYFMTFIVMTTYCLMSAFNSLITSAMVESQANQKQKEEEEKAQQQKKTKEFPIKLNLYNEKAQETIVYSGYATIFLTDLEEYKKTESNEN